MRGLWGTTAAAAVLSLLAAVPAHAEDITAPDEQEITVTATRTETDISRVPAVVSVITEEEIEENLVTDIKDLVRFEPGVSVRTQPMRFGALQANTGRAGNSSFNIRGLEGDRVLFVIDGVRLPEALDFGPGSFGRGDAVDLDILSRVEILRGPASALYGSDGVGGAVNFITRDPGDLLEEGDVWGGRARVSYSSADDSFTENLIGAAHFGDWEAMVGYTRRDGHELDNQGENDALNNTRTTPNPSDTESNAVLAKLVFSPFVGHRFRLSYDYGDRFVSTEAYSGRAVPPLGATSVIDLDGTDESTRERYTFDHRFEDFLLFDRGQWAVYWQESNAVQFSDEDRNVSADRTRTTSFDNTVWGGSLQLESVLQTGSVSHRFTYGGDFARTEQAGLREGTGPLTGGDPLPARPFPNTDYDQWGVFVQDEISLLGGQLVFYPAVRYDGYELSATDDALFRPGAPEPDAVAQQEDTHVSPKLGIVAWPTEHFGAFFNYAEGFRAPAPTEVNNFFENLTQGYTSIANPDLRPETSESFEAGLRLRDVAVLGGTLRASASAFVSDYEDFIAQDIIGGTGAPGNPLIYQYVNFSDVTINGVEGRADLTWSNGFGLTIAASSTEGEQQIEGVESPLNTIDPWRVVTGLSYDDPQGRFGGQLIYTYAADKEDADVTQECTTAFGSPTPCFIPDGFSLVDLTGYWNVTAAATLRLGVFNVTDETYSYWGDVRGLAANSTTLDAYTQPGRNYSVSIAYRF